jgi:hypothetical protein
MLDASARLLIFAKAPVEGKVKTRLIPRLGTTTATQLQRLMTAHVVQMATMSELCPVELWCHPDTSHEFFQNLQRKYPIALYQQVGKDLGEKMFNAARHAIESSRRVIIIGSDCLQYTPHQLQQALDALAENEHRVVLTPAQDGGYVLIGMNHVDQRLFENIDWGTSAVLAQTRQALKRLDREWLEMPVLQDIDVETDLEAILEYLPQYPLSPDLTTLLQRILTTLKDDC